MDIQTTKDDDLRKVAQEALQSAETAYYKYAASLPVGNERMYAFAIFENIRVAGRVY